MYEGKASVADCLACDIAHARFTTTEGNTGVNDSSKCVCLGADITSKTSVRFILFFQFFQYLHIVFPEFVINLIIIVAIIVMVLCFVDLIFSFTVFD